MSKVQVDRVGVHVTHCCKLHGCKYSNDNCPVVNNQEEQAYPCEVCEFSGLNDVESINELKALSDAVKELDDEDVFSVDVKMLKFLLRGQVD